jgi:hypothetical protein
MVSEFQHPFDGALRGHLGSMKTEIEHPASPDPAMGSRSRPQPNWRCAMTLELLWLLQLKEASPSLSHRPNPICRCHYRVSDHAAGRRKTNASQERLRKLPLRK